MGVHKIVFAWCLLQGLHVHRVPCKEGAWLQEVAAACTQLEIDVQTPEPDASGRAQRHPICQELNLGLNLESKPFLTNSR